MFKLVSFLLSGLLTGALARLLYPGAVSMGLGRTILLGLGGSLLAGLATSLADGSSWRDGASRAGCIASVIGAMALIFIGRHF